MSENNVKKDGLEVIELSLTYLKENIEYEAESVVTRAVSLCQHVAEIYIDATDIEDSRAVIQEARDRLALVDRQLLEALSLLEMGEKEDEL